MNIRKANSGKIVISEKKLEQKLASPKYRSDDIRFDGRSVDVKSKATLGDRMWEMVYHFKGDAKASKELKRKQFLEYCIELLGRDELSEAAQAELKKQIENSQVFNEVLDHTDIMRDDIMRIRIDVLLAGNPSQDSLYKMLLSDVKLSDSQRSTIFQRMDKATLKRSATEFQWRHKWDDLVECYKEILKLPGLSQVEHIETLRQLADAYQEQGKTDLAIECYEEILKLPGVGPQRSFIQLIRLIGIYDAYGNIDKVIECCERVLKLPGNLGYDQEPRVLMKLADAYRQKRNIGAMIDYYERSLRSPYRESYIDRAQMIKIKNDLEQYGKADRKAQNIMNFVKTLLNPNP